MARLKCLAPVLYRITWVRKVPHLLRWFSDDRKSLAPQWSERPHRSYGDSDSISVLDSWSTTRRFQLKVVAVHARNYPAQSLMRLKGVISTFHALGKDGIMVELHPLYGSIHHNKKLFRTLYNPKYTNTNLKFWIPHRHPLIFTTELKFDKWPIGI